MTSISTTTGNMKVTVVGPWDAVLDCCDPHAEATVMISISDLNLHYAPEPFCSDENNVQRILALCFSDADEPGPDIYGRNTTIDVLMSDKDAR